MRRFGLAALLVLGFAAEGARAGIVASATWLESVLGVPVVVPVIATGTSTETSISVSLELPEFAFETMTPVAGVPTFATMTTLTLIVLHDSPMIDATPNMATASKGIQAGARVLFGVPGLGRVPLYALQFSPGAVRHAGTIYPPPYFTLPPFETLVYVSPTSFGWTPGAVTLTGLTEDGVAAPDAKAKGTFMLNAAGAGTVTLVAPRRIGLRGHPLGDRTVGSFTTLTLHFVPEPAAWLLLAAAAVVSLRRYERSPLRQRPDA